MSTTRELEAFASHSRGNQIEILRSKECGCFFCRSLFEAKRVQDWQDMSALCPNCGMASVIGDASGVPMDKALLKEMNLHFYGDDYMEKHLDACETYCRRYISGNITPKKHNEQLLIKYLGVLARHGHPNSILTLGSIYEYGGLFTPQNIPLAYDFYYRPELDTDPTALISRGRIELNYGQNDPINERRAYENFAKATALGSYAGLYEMACCYFKGIFVQKDPSFGFALLRSAIDDVFQNVMLRKSDFYDLVDYGLQLGICYYKGLGVEQDHLLATRYFLLARFALSKLPSIGVRLEGEEGDIASISRDIENYIAKLAKKHGFQQGLSPVLDQDTFYDTFSDTQEMVTPKQFAGGHFDKEEGEFEFDITFPYSPIIIDCANLFCDFLPATTHWRFTEVAEAEQTSDGLSFYNRIVTYHDGDSWEFERMEENGERACVAFVRFFSDPRAVEAVRVLNSMKLRGDNEK